MLSRHFHSNASFPFLHPWLVIILLGTPLLFLPGTTLAKTFYSIRLASYQNKEAAVKRVNELKKLGHHAFMRTVNLGHKGTWHRVYIERYDTRAEAVKEARNFNHLELISEYGIDPIYEKSTSSASHTGAGQKIFFLHVFSFQEIENAKKTVGRLRDEGLKAFYVREQIKGKTWYRVYVGEYSSESSARRAGSDLKKKGLITYFKPVEINRNIMKKDDL
jgi:cell division septation protein DedD